MSGGAVISDCGLYRYGLWRAWGDRTAPTMTFVMLNPSTADGTEDDPTIRRCIGFAKREGFDRLAVVNLYPYRATNPADLWDAMGAGIDVRGRSDELIRTAPRHLVVAAWGARPKLPRKFHDDRVAVVRDLLGGTLHCLGTTKAGDPRHPLYLRSDAPLTPWPALLGEQ